MTTFDPQPFGKYFLVDKIAVGGMAEVFKAKSFSHGGFEKLLVIKRILQHLSENLEFVEMFIDEAKISVSLQHANIVQIYDFGKIHENYFIAMECVEGKDVKLMLRKLAKARKLLPVPYALYIAHEMCKGLSYAHRKADIQGTPMNIIHRDISPSNILVSYTGDVKIADFGIAKARSSLFTTKDGVLKGKFEYMSPEQASGQDLDARSDVFATGIILHEMLTGRRLFKTDSEIKTLEKVRAADVPTPSAINPLVPTWVDRIVQRALARDASERYQSAKEMQQDLFDHLAPATPDKLHEELGVALNDLFSEEIEAERTRLTESTRQATALWEQAPELELDGNWLEGEAPSSGTLRTQAPLSRNPLVGAGALALGVGLMGGAWMLTRDPPPAEPKIETIPSTATIQVIVTPAVDATFRLDGKEIGSGHELLYQNLTVGTPHKLSIEAEGYETIEETIQLEALERLRLPVDLQALPTKKTRRAPKAASKPKESQKSEAKPKTKTEPKGKGRITVNLTQGWAHVYVDGKKLSETTPLYNYELTEGSHTIRVLNAELGVEETKTVLVTAGGTQRISFDVE